MIFDVRTLVVITLSASVIAVLAMLFLYIGHRQERALKHAVYALAMQSLGLFSLALRNVAPDWLSIVVANTLIIVGGVYLMVGSVRIFYRRAFRLRWLVLLGLLTLAIFWYLTYVRNDYFLRVVAFAVIASGLAFMGAREFFRPVEDEIWCGPRLLTMALLLGYGVSALVRIPMAWVGGTRELLAPTVGNMISYLSGSLLLGLWPFLMALLVGQRLLAQQRHLAMTDLLTGVLNRRGFEEAMQREFSRAARKNETLSLLLLDIDHFKQINDRFGHQLGDRVLALLTKHVSGTLRTEDVFGRLGGEEFGVILPSINHAQALEVAERIRGLVAALPIDAAQAQAHITVSIGVASTDADGREWDSLYRVADQRLYDVKTAGRNQVRGRG
ncbi:MAG: GGDEF domain-containing protein [Rhodocyclaceae bacterium]|nr:MAG: GGDEF domain-containing protein [Rhodocyclaceae bacterium]